MYKHLTTLFISSLVLFTFVTGANAWDYCFQDSSYTPELQMDVATGDVIHGQAILLGNPSFPAAITGKWFISQGVNWIVFFIDYSSGSSRFYEWDLDSMIARTWGATEGFIGPQEVHTIVPCGATEDVAETQLTGMEVE